MEFIKIILSLDNRFDYLEYEYKMKEAGLHVASIGNFAQVVGMLSVAMTQYPDMPPEAAYMQFISDMNNAVASAPEQQAISQPAKSGCGGCGGGKTR
mgnify:CR=1 FL=1